MDKPRRDGRDEMNLAVLPIAKLGRNDPRDTIEYYGTFKDGDKQEKMVWTVRGAAGLGLPSEFAERVLVALLHLGAQSNFADRRMEFTPYQILKILGHTINGRNYGAVEQALAQLHGVTITSDKAWIEKRKDGSQKRVTTKRGFHLIDEYFLHYAEPEEEDEGEDASFIVWGSRIWRNLQAGYIRRLDIDFYYALDLPLARRLYRLLDKLTHYKPQAPYVIDIFDLANKLGMTTYQYASQLKRPLAAAADELVARGYLVKYEFYKAGKFNRIRFYRYAPLEQALRFERNTDETFTVSVADQLWADLLLALSANVARHLTDTRLIRIENGTATIAAGKKRDWIENRLGDRILKALQSERDDVTAVRFVE
jgi:plasmid replication initiation protein